MHDFGLVRRLASLIGALLVPTTGIIGQTMQQQGQASMSNVSVTAAIVLADLTVRPLAAFPLRLVSATDSTKVVDLHTALDGSVTQDVPPGKYLLVSVNPVTVNDSTYRWAVAVDARPGRVHVELSNANATTSHESKRIARQVAPEREVFEKSRGSVFKVEAGLATGSGFLIKVPGVEAPLVLTDDHVVVNDSTATIYLDSVTRVPARVVGRDRDADLALLRLPQGRCSTCTPLPIATLNKTDTLVVVGERVLAIGFPLHQSMTLTTGVVSSVREGAIISDVNINHGNSGGPMLNLAGQVVGVNAFGDFTDQGGPGISGAIAITKLAKLAQSIGDSVARVAPPKDASLPTMPIDAYPVAALKDAADTVDPRSYRKLLQRDADHFQLNISTPVMIRVEQRMFENEVGEERRKREAQAGVSKDQAYSETKQSHDWEQYVGEANTPVVTITVSPKVTETGGSAFLRGLSAMNGVVAQASYVFDADVRGAHFYRNGIEVMPIFGGHGPVVQNLENAYVKLKDVADYGYYVLPPELFAPDSDGAPARVRIAIADLKRPSETSGTEFVGEASARIWNDFRAYYQRVHPEHPFVAANPSMHSRPAEMDCFEGRCEKSP